MRYAREPRQKQCRRCTKRFVGYDPDRCPSCGGFGWGPANDRGVPRDELVLADLLATCSIVAAFGGAEFSQVDEVAAVAARGGYTRQRRAKGAV